METHEQTQRRFQAALDGLAAQLDQDHYVLAAIVYGSVARGEAWEKSDVDLTIVVRDDQERATGHRWLDYRGINISADITSRSGLKRMMDGAPPCSSFMVRTMPTCGTTSAPRATAGSTSTANCTI